MHARKCKVTGKYFQCGESFKGKGEHCLLPRRDGYSNSTDICEKSPSYHDWNNTTNFLDL